MYCQQSRHICVLIRFFFPFSMIYSAYFLNLSELTGMRSLGGASPTFLKLVLSSLFRRSQFKSSLFSSLLTNVSGSSSSKLTSGEPSFSEFSRLGFLAVALLGSKAKLYWTCLLLSRSVELESSCWLKGLASENYIGSIWAKSVDPPVCVRIVVPSWPGAFVAPDPPCTRLLKNVELIQFVNNLEYHFHKFLNDFRPFFTDPLFRGWLITDWISDIWCHFFLVLPT